MAVALATLETNIYTTFYNFLTSGTYSLITSGHIGNANQVTPVYSYNTAAKYGYPIIQIADPVIVAINTDRFGDVQKAECSVAITVVEDNASESKSVMDKVRSNLLSGYSTFKTVGMHKVPGADWIVESGRNIISKNKKHYHYKTISVNFIYHERLA